MPGSGGWTAHSRPTQQLYTIHVKCNDEFVVQLWCLLPDKTGPTYDRLFRLLKQKAAQLNLPLQPIAIHVDFEQAVIQAIRTHFGIGPSGCLFHFSQSILRHLGQAGLQVAYNTNAPPEIRKLVRRMMAMALIPPLRIDQALQALTASAQNVVGYVVECDAMIQYMRHTYVDPNALFQRPLWNCFGQMNRTTNVCEGYHHIINEKFRRGRPDPFQFVHFLQEQQADIERRVAQLQVGAPPRKRKAAYVHVDDALERLRNQYFGARIPNVAGLLQYMDAVAHQMYDVKH
jgi:hypothetical protein